jgi:hypothetical protein
MDLKPDTVMELIGGGCSLPTWLLFAGMSLSSSRVEQLL